MKLFTVILSFFVKLGELLSNIYGWLIMIGLIILDFLVDYKIAFIGVIVCIFIDMFVGIWSALKQKKYAKSELMRDTFSKLFIYCGALVMVAFIERLIGIDAIMTTEISAAIICATELWSIAGNALIINPNLYFFKLIKFALVGEIARKLNIEEHDVKETLEKGDSLIEKSATVKRQRKMKEIKKPSE
jgi:hypothetical protein